MRCSSRSARRRGFEDVWQLHWGDAGGRGVEQPGRVHRQWRRSAGCRDVADRTASRRGRRRAAVPGGLGGGGGRARAADPVRARRRPVRQVRVRRAERGPVGPVAGAAADRRPVAPARLRSRGRAGRPGRRTAPGVDAVLASVRRDTRRPTRSRSACRPDGTYTVTNTRNDFSKTYQPVHRPRPRPPSGAESGERRLPPRSHEVSASERSVENTNRGGRGHSPARAVSGARSAQQTG